MDDGDATIRTRWRGHWADRRLVGAHLLEMVGPQQARRRCSTNTNTARHGLVVRGEDGVRENSPQDCGGARGGGLVGARWGGDRRRREEEEEKGRLFDEEEEEGIDLRQALAHI